MNARAGIAWHNEYNWWRQEGTGPGNTTQSVNELLLGFDIAF